MTATAITVCLLTLACGSPNFYVNPTSAPTSAASPEPSASPTSTPSPTPEPADLWLASPERLILNAMEKIRYRDHLAVHGRFLTHLESRDDADVEDGAGSETWPEIMVTVEGEYTVTTYPEDPWAPIVSFNLLFHHEPAADESGAALGPWDTQVEVKERRFLSDTTENHFQTYATYQEWLSMAYIEWTDDDLPTLATLLGLALTEDVILEYEMLTWMQFSEDEVYVITPIGENGSELWVMGATRTQPNGDVEEWTFWIDEDEMPRKIGLTIDNETAPSRRIWDAELELSETGECLPVLPCPQ
jgi:hypothetical protein